MTATASAPPDTRDCRLYRFYGWDPRTNYTTKTLIYVGETVRQPFTRLMEHIESQPWADTITSWEVDDRVYAGKTAVLAAETAAIRAERPLYNVKENMGNPVRVKPWEAVAQRHRRDDEAGRPRWAEPADASPQPRLPKASTRSSVPASRRRNRNPSRQRQIVAATWAGAWAILAWMMWDGTSGFGPAAAPGRLWFCGLAPLALLGWGTWFGPRVWRRACRRIRRWFR